MFKMIVFCIITLFARLYRYLRVGVLLTCRTHLSDSIISLTRQVWDPNKTSLTPQLFIEMPVPIQKNEWSCICVIGVSIQPLSMMGPGGSMGLVVGSNSSCKPITNTACVRAQLCKLQKGWTRLAAASDNVYQCLPRVGGFPGTPASSTTKTGRHDIAEIVLRVALSTKNSIHSFLSIICLMGF